MPTYEFICEKCKKSFTLIMKISEYEKKKFQCPKCKSKKVKQQVTSFQTITSSKSLTSLGPFNSSCIADM